MHFKVGSGWVHAVDGVSFDLSRGETLGIVGESGSGKTSLGYTLLRLLEANGRIMGGQIIFDGVDICALSDVELRHYRWKRIAMVFQNAMSALNPVLRVGDQIIDAIRYHSTVGRSAARASAAALFERVGLSAARLDGYPHEFSGGMKQRVMIALSLACGPELLIADEATTALDVVAQQQVLAQMKILQRDLGLAMVFISHDMAVIAKTCSAVAVMYAGELVEWGPTDQLLRDPRHPYTISLLRSYPSVRGAMKPLLSVAGSPPDLVNLPAGCRFHPRCPVAQSICREQPPRLVQTGNGRWARCHFAEQMNTKDIEIAADAARA